MVAVEAICTKCGEKFLRGIYPQSKCDQCAMKEPHKYYTTEGIFVGSKKVSSYPLRCY